MTLAAIRDTLYRKSTNFVESTERRGFIPHEDFYRPATHPIYFAAVSPDKIFRLSCRAVFSFGKLHLEFFISRLNEILRHDLTLSVGEPDNAAAKQGQELRSV